jgi:ribosomal protein S18 acetylase RimI-like enzyme
VLELRLAWWTLEGCESGHVSLGTGGTRADSVLQLRLAWWTLEGCESGRIGTIGNRVWGNSPRVQIPVPPLTQPLSLRSINFASGASDLNVEFVVDFERAIAVMREAASWLAESSRAASSFWPLEMLTPEGLASFADPDEFYVGLVDGDSAIAAVLRTSPVEQLWSLADGNRNINALYIYWLAVSRRFAGQGWPAMLMNFAKTRAQQIGCDRLRLAVAGSEPKLIDVYERLGFEQVIEVFDELDSTVLLERLIASSH